MHSIKKSSSGFQIIGGKFGISSVAYNKSMQKICQLEFELERQKDTMIKLQLEIEQKNEELNSILSKNKKKKNKFNKTIKLIEEVLKLCDNTKLDKNNSKEKEVGGVNNDNEEMKRETEINFNLYNEKIKEDFKTINNDNNDNVKTFYKTNNNYNKRKTSLPKIKSPKNKLTININYNFNFKHKKKLKELQYVSTLKNKLNLLNDKLEKKHGEMLKLQNNNTISNFSKLQNDFISNCDKLNEFKKKNLNMLAKLIDIEDTYFDEKEQNNKLKIKLGDFVEQFNDYKYNISQKNKTLENKLKTIEDKNIDCILYHRNDKENKNINKSLFDGNLINRSKLTETESILFRKGKEVKEIRKDIDSKNININIYKKEIDQLNKKKSELNDKNVKNKDNSESLNNKKLELNNKHNENQEKNKDLKKKLNESENKYKIEVNKINEIKDNINNKNKEIEKLKKEIEEIKNLKIIEHFKSNNI